MPATTVSVLPVPRVLLQAQKEAATQIPEKETSLGQGAWDQGHWANRS